MRYAHTNIVAKDWKKLSEFYIKVFECVEIPPKRDLAGDWLDQAIGLTDAKLEGIHLLLPGHGGNGPTLEIFSYAETVDRDPLQANHSGFSHIAFEVDNVRTIFERAMQYGGRSLGNITQKAIPGVGLLTLVYFRDPEGNIVEIQSWSD